MLYQLPLIHVLVPAWELRALIIGGLLLIAVAAVGFTLWQLSREERDEQTYELQLPRLVDLDDYAPGELTGTLLANDIWALIIEDMRDEADIIDRWLAAGCPPDCTPWAIEKLITDRY